MRMCFNQIFLRKRVVVKNAWPRVQCIVRAHQGDQKEDYQKQSVKY